MNRNVDVHQVHTTGQRHHDQRTDDRTGDGTHTASRRDTAHERSRDRVLTDAELCAVWNASSKMSYPIGHFVKLLILTGQRIREVASLKRSEISEVHNIWTIPAAKTKNQLDQEVPLSPQALSVIASCPKLGDYLLMSGRRAEQPINCFSGAKRDIDVILAEDGPIGHWTWHDLRRTFRTGLSGLGIDPHIAERTLNHIDGGLRRVYDRHDYRELKRNAMERWGNFIETTLAKKVTGADVILLHSA